MFWERVLPKSTLHVRNNLRNRQLRADRYDFLIERADLRRCKWSSSESGDLGSGEVRLEIDRFALTANNITYATLGQKFRYWEFFPAAPEYGRLPVWGFANVTESRVNGLEVGERIYGYLPVSTELVVRVDELMVAGFTDCSPWRTDLPSVYNRYLRVSRDPAFASPGMEALQALFRPLFATSFLIDGFLAENGFFEAKHVLIASASSKTALALAYCLQHRPGRECELVGLTSTSNVEFVLDTGFYDRVVDYHDVGTLPVEPAVFVDMAGSAKLRSIIHHHFGDALKYSCAVGNSHWEEVGRAAGLPGPRATVFFAPSYVDAKVALWGVEGYEKRLSEAWDPFSKAIDGLLDISTYAGQNQIEQLYRSVLEGRLSPRVAAMASVRS